MAASHRELDELVDGQYPDPFDNHPLSYPLPGPKTASLRSISHSPISSYPPSSLLRGQSDRSSHTSIEATWFDDATDSDICETDMCRANFASKSPHDSLMAPDEAGSCNFDRDDWFAQFDGELDISDDPPPRSVLAQAGEIPIYDAAGNSRAFKTVFARGEVVGDKQLVVFIRHFYCGACKAYIDALVSHMRADPRHSPTSIVIIGCGKPDLIRQYKASTQCPYPIFADPTRQIFKLLGMGISLNILGPRRPEYMKDISLAGWMNGQLEELAKVKGKKKFRGGNLLQIGGEFLFEDGEVVWCHRMRNYRGHAEMDVIRRVLHVDR